MDPASVNPGKLAELAARMRQLGLHDSALVEKFILGSGKGGQKINKTSSCVYLRHLPSGIEIKCQLTRSRALNRYYARKQLCDRIEEERLGALSTRRQEIERIRRQKRRRSRRQRERLLHDKHHHALKKTARRHPSSDSE